MRIDYYDWRGGREAMLRFGPAHGPAVVAALPLLEEANRTRAFVVTVLRALAARDIAAVLPDLPGQGESLASIGAHTIPDLAEAMALATDAIRGAHPRTYAFGVRSGALIDDCARHDGRWHLAPATGAEVLRDLHRIWLASEPRPDRSIDAMINGEAPVEIAGNALSTDFLSSLSAGTPFDSPAAARRVVRLATDPGDADRKVEGVPLWRRAEPGNDPALADLLAADIADWIATCER